MRLVKTCILLIVLLIILTGCWDERQISEVNYITTLGIDYQEDNYIIYVQMLDFSNVAKQESGKTSERTPLYIGKATGKTINDAVNNLYRTSQQVVNWAHIGAIIYSDAILEKGVTDAEQSLRKNGQFRYTPWMFGTKESVEEIMSLSGFYQLPPVYTILYKPLDMFNEYSYIAPLRMHKFVSIYKEPGGTAILPSISINDKSWKESKEDIKPKQTLEINGVFPVNDGKSKEWLSFKEVPGLRWTQEDTNNTTIDILTEDNVKKGSVRILEPTVKFIIKRGNKNFQFNIQLKASGSVTDLEEQLPMKEIENLVRQQMKKEIRETYEIGVEKGVDLYNIKNKLFHDRVKPDQLQNYSLTKEKLNRITVDFHLETEGVYE
ncbi:Ger(x)C family spore germination protein [Virgibacillus salexigens]|uniref:Spore germination protein YfkR n=1 Tax=Virgibacillus kapii TaxID=1638645 RepID=A0ABQ2DXZ9_9BACI|nr:MULTISPECIES: Ger(x)C family spore germination protein [Virgibacillus]MYL42530.1 Ger(x)C family spore germination protein [Virgibacillus massiliensis]GGJ74474.1 putative spore germination protein YfkR [Virgibacillus kapii]